MNDSNSDDDFLKTEITYAIVLRADIQDVQAVKEFISKLDKVHVIYQKSSGGRLFIQEGGKREID